MSNAGIPPYVSQQATILAGEMAYLQNPANWVNGIPGITDYTVGSVLYTLLAIWAVGVDAIGLEYNQVLAAAYITTAVGQDLDNKLADFGLTRKPATSAVGTFTFSCNNPATSTITIPSGSQISTVPSPGAAAQVYSTDTTVTITIGNTSVNVQATDTVTGSAGNIAANTQLLISSAITGVDTVTLSTNVTDGTDIETDASFRARGLAAFQALAHGTIASYTQIVLAVPGVVSAIVVPQNRGPGTVDIFIMGANGSIPSTDVQAEAQTAIYAQKVATDDVLVLLPTPQTITVAMSVHLAAGYDPTATTAAVQEAIITYIDGLGVGAGSLGNIYAAQLEATALSVAGVVNARTTFTDTAISGAVVPTGTTGSVTVAVF